MPKKYGIIASLIAFALIVFGILIAINKNDPEAYIHKKVTGTVKNLELTDFKLEKIGVYYNFKAILTKTDDSNFKPEDYAIYLLDNDENLIYLIDGSRLGDFNYDSNQKIIDSQIDYDVKLATKAVIVNKNYGYKINKDIRKSIKHVPTADKNGYYTFEVN